MNLVLPETAKLIRLGRETPDKKRPLKVILPTKQEALQAFKCKKILEEDQTGIYMKNDRTEAQRKLLREILTELQKQKAEGKTNLIIKYINGAPKIVEKVEKN